VDGLIVHIARETEWLEAKSGGEYVPSTLPRDGFIHLSRPEQAHLPANAMYSGQQDLVLLWVDQPNCTPSFGTKHPSRALLSSLTSTAR
jgi:uncharacterized protein (DUF952 family)